MEAKTELQKNAVTVARRKEEDSFQRALDIQWLNNRMEDGRMGRCLALIQREAEMEKDFQERTDHAAIVNARAQKETALGIEVAKVRREEACQLLRRHYLRERDPSLRELTKKLQAGYVCRDLRQQILNNEYKRLQDKAEQQHANMVLSNALYNDKQAKEKEDQEKMQKNKQYCLELQQQLVNKQRVRQCQYEDSLIEKKMLEDIMRTISEEDKKELQQRRAQTARARADMAASARARGAWRRRQTQQLLAEERRVQDQVREAADRSSADVAERERILRVKEELNKKAVDKILADEAARLERENIIKSLQEQEYLEKNFQDDIAGKKKMERVKTETKDALTAQMEDRKRLAREQREREAEFRKQAEAKIEADNEKEREKERKKKEKSRLYSIELLKQIEDNARKREKEQELEKGRAQYVRDCDKAWRNEVSEERKKLVEEHVPRLLGFLQPGVVVDSDLPALTAAVDRHAHLTADDVRALATANRPARRGKCNPQCMILREY